MSEEYENKDHIKKTIIVTGGSRGIGKSIAKELAELGFNIAILYEKDSKAAEETAFEIEKDSGIECLTYQASVADVTAINQCVNDIECKGGKIYGLINNAGIIRDGFLMTMPENDWLSVINTNLFGTFNCSKAVLPLMKKNGGGIIVNIASISGIKGEAAQVNYSATKSAIVGFTRSLAVELIEHSISVYAIAPGFIETEMVKVLSPKIVENNIKNIPMHRFGKTDDIANIIRFIFKENPSYMQGHVFIPDGGLNCI
ncbi:beta-ketoacyl-ACP reductase [Clostridium zeae]|uniref:Beta-ketoacyl-ACP reductase n=1 Tax=Clostridium zeae TaxID=2759022 RepID=A0ABQ1E817_9CLOT|nr:SDR family NAD(P)-dependent oxidoreductase [Clostridium zeae]GFZ30883.1 beta-ketoacyl-ACP reductase [Clostridium zeae]